MPDEERPSVVFPEQEVRLLSGEYVVIRPWTLSVGRRMRRRITTMFDELRKTKGQEAINYASLVDKFEDDLVEIVKETIGVDDEWMEAHLAYEDLLALIQGVLEVCVFRGKDQGGFLGRLLGMANQMGLNEEAVLPEGLAARLEEARSAGKTSPTSSEKTGLPEDSPSLPAGATGIPST
jgi:hypothetical protein